MAVFKCKMCGGDLEVHEHESVAVCEYCGTKQTLPKLDDDKKANLYDRANHFRRNNDFDKAMGIYESILNEDNTDAEAYWSLVLCRYGIEYVEDPSTHKRVPTVNRAQYTSIFDDEDYKSAIEYADAAQRTVYEAEANAINEIQKGILEISQKEEPFDVFICYKETDEQGRRTQDSVIATELYYELQKAGFKVFFSRITLEDKLGTAYEPYIFAALHSSKVMVVLGTKAEYFNAVWVKNEWSRYLSLIKNGDKKILIPAYRDMDPYDLPEEFSHLQAQDMSKLGFMQDLIRGIKKITATDAPKAAVKETVVINQNSGEVEPLLKRAFIFLEDGDFQSADEYCEKVLDLDPENANAYLGKLMAELEVEEQEDLKNLAESFEDNANYEKILRFGDQKLKTELDNSIKFIYYRQAKSAMDTAKTEVEYENAIQMLENISGWKDADDQIVACQSKIQEIKEKEGQDRLERERQAELRRQEEEKRKKKNKKIAMIVSPIVCVCIVFLIVLNTVIIPSQKLKKANTLIESGDYDTAYVLLEEIERYDVITENKYNRSLALIESGDYITAYELLDGLNYKDSEEKLQEIKPEYQKAVWKNPRIGDILLFGIYEQDNNTANGKEDIEWQVLDKQDGKILVISKYALNCKQYNTKYEDITWESCTLRKWLNSDFLNAAFTAEEQRLIPTVTVSADKNPEYSTSPGNATQDQIFLLSIPEVNKYFFSDDAMICEPTPHAVENNAYEADSGNCWWWLRSSGGYEDRATFVTYYGGVNASGFDVTYGNCAVRPALWIDLES